MSSEQSDTQGWRGLWVSSEREPGVAKQQEGIQTLQQAIMQDAQEQVEQILADARTRAESVRAQAEAEANAKRDAILQRAQRDAEVLNGQVIARAQMEAQTLKLKRREQLLEYPFAEARQQLASAPQWPDYEKIVRRLMREAVRHLDADDALVRVDAETRKVLTADVLADLASELGVDVRLGASLDRGTGVVAETPDGHRRYDNMLETRLARLRESLRTPVSRILMGETP